MLNATTSSPLNILLLILAAAQCCTGFPSRAGLPARLPHHGVPSHDVLPRCVHPRRHGRNRSSRLHPNAGDGEDDEGADDIAVSEEGGGKKKDEERAGLTWEELMSDPELRQIEFDSSINRKNAMLLPQRISAAVTTVGWLFVGGGILLNQLGLAYVRDPAGGIRIGSLDERDFQAEVVRVGRREAAAAEEKKGRYPSISRSGDWSVHVLSWLDLEKEWEEESQAV
jgi:hypothetical protein